MSLKYIVYIIVILVGLTSCEHILFQHPQPVDVKNENTIPKKYRGVWAMDGDTISINKTKYSTTKHDTLDLDLLSLNSQQSYQIKGSTLYYTDYDKLVYGRIIKMTDASIRYVVKRTESTWLDDYTLIRKVKLGHIISTKDNEEYQWWDVVFISKNKQNDVIVKALSKNDLHYIQENDILLKSKKLTYVSTRWTKDSLDLFIGNGMFKDTIIHLTNNHRIR